MGNSMIKLSTIIVFVGLNSILLFGQNDTIDPGMERFNYLMDSIANETKLRPTYKTGDNDIVLKEPCKLLFTDTTIFDLFRNHYSLQGLYVRSSIYGEQKMIFPEWFEKHVVNSPYQNNDDYIMGGYHTDEYLVINFIDALDQTTLKRVIQIGWDNTNPEMEIEFGNLRYITDTELNTTH